MEISIFDSCLPNTALEEVLVGTGFIGLTIFLAEHISLPIIARVLGGDGVLDFFVVRQILKELV